jgi:hypothetical protein
MQLLERYLNAVRFWLPKGQKDDILAELSEDLRATIAEREDALGRPLARDELAELLKHRGHPLIVATAYLPQRSLIGPALFPIYVFVLKTVGLIFVGPWTGVWTWAMFYIPGAARAHPQTIDKLTALWSMLWVTVFVVFGIVTLIFAIVERVNGRLGLFHNWDPKSLPPAVAEVPRSTSIFELAASLTFAIWWAAAMSSREISAGSSVALTLTPLWPYFFWGFLAVMLVNVALAAVNLMRPYWTRRRALLRLASDGCGSALFCWMLKANVVVSLSVAGVRPERTAEIVRELALWCGRGMPIAVAIGVGVAFWDARRVWRVNGGPTGPARAAAAFALVLFAILAPGARPAAARSSGAERSAVGFPGLPRGAQTS